MSPSGHIYSREAIIEYLLNKSKDLKKAQKEYEEQQERVRADVTRQMDDARAAELADFKSNTEDVLTTGQKRSQAQISVGTSSAAATDTDGQTVISGVTTTTVSTEQQRKRQKLIDETDRHVRLEQLKSVSPWVPQFTPSAERVILSEPPKRPPSPFSGAPLRSKDLISIDLVREDNPDDSTVRFVCPVSRKTITSQKVVLIKSTGAIMIEQAAKELAFPTMTCPLTGKTFRQDDVLELASAGSGFAARGNIEAKVHRPTIN